MLNRLIALGLILGLITGLAAAMTGNPVLQGLASLSAPLGAVFINAVKMVVIPLVVTIIFASVARLADPTQLGRIGGLALAFYVGTLACAVAIGMGVMSIGLAFAPEMPSPAAEAVAIPELRGLTEFFIGLIPPNPFAAAANGALLPLIVFTALVAAATGTLATDRRDRMVQGAEDISAALIKLVWWVLWLAPVGVFGLIAPATAKMGWSLIQSLGLFIGCVAVGLVLFWVFVFAPLTALLARVSPMRFLRGTASATAVAFSTTSTATAIPVALQEVQDLGASETVADLLVPLGASIYRPGSALFQAAAIVFLAHLYDVPLGAAGWLTVGIATLLVSLTVAPVPSSGVVTMAPALATVGVPVAGLALLLGIDRIPDMMRSAVNGMGQWAVTLIVGRITKGVEIGIEAEASDKPD